MSKNIAVAERNMQIANEFNEGIFTEHDLSVIDEYVSPDFVQYGNGDKEVHGIEAAREYFGGVLEAFPDIELETIEMLADDETVMFRFHASGTHDGDFPMGEDAVLPATGKHVSWDGFVSCRIEDEKMVETHVVSDVASMMDQLGLMPAVDDHAA